MTLQFLFTFVLLDQAMGSSLEKEPDLACGQTQSGSIILKGWPGLYPSVVIQSLVRQCQREESCECMCPSEIGLWLSEGSRFNPLLSGMEMANS